MLRQIKEGVRRILPAFLWNRLKDVQRRLRFLRAAGFSDEEPTIMRYLASVEDVSRFAVDIAAQDGVGGSQTLGLFKAGWHGVAVEFDAEMFAVLAKTYQSLPDVDLVRTRVKPSNVCSILTAVGCPKNFGFLSLDIDSYDFFILEALLREFRPSLMCVEINETIPPPIAFTVTFSDDHVWDGSHFQGQSIAKCHELCVAHDYDIVELHYNNLLIMPAELNRHPKLTPDEAYDRGYRHRPDRREKFPWNADMEELLSMPTADAIAFLERKFVAQRGRYLLEL
jgi:hypothetical protein